MDPMTALAIGSAAAPVIGGILGQNAAAGDRAAANAAYQRAYEQYAGLNIPDEEKMKLALQSPEVQGILQPAMETATQEGPSAMAGVNADPRLKQAQMQALDTMSKMGQTGLTAADTAALNQIHRQVGGDEHSREASILQNMQQRGMGGSGAELASRLSSSQHASDLASQQSDNQMSMAQKRMLDAISSSGNLSTQMRSQDVGEQSDIAKAKDAIAQFNALQQAGTNTRNTSSANSAQAANLAEKQRVADAAVANANAQQQYNKQLPQQTFANQMQLASARSNAAIGQGNQYNNQAQQTGQMYAGVGAGVGQAGMGYLNYQNNQDMMNELKNKLATPAATPALKYTGSDTNNTGNIS